MSYTTDNFSAKISIKEHFWQDLIGVWKITLLSKDPVVYYHGGWVGEVIIQYKANSFRLNLPTGTELGNITGYLESFPPNQLPQGVAIFELTSAFSDFYPILKFFLQLTPNWP